MDSSNRQIREPMLIIKNDRFSFETHIEVYGKKSSVFLKSKLMVGGWLKIFNFGRLCFLIPSNYSMKIEGCFFIIHQPNDTTEKNN